MAMRRGNSFLAPEVVDLYRHRPPYPRQLFDRLRALARPEARVLDLGAGPGKTGRVLAAHFRHVTAVDPSDAMISLGKVLPGGDRANLDWVNAYAEDVPLTGQYDLIVAALSIHWMDHPRLFPHLATHVTPDHVLAVLEGDAPHNPPWQNDWQSFLTKWVPVMTGEPFDPSVRPAFWNRYQQHVDVIETLTFMSEPVQQTIDDFILCQHSRDTFAISKMGTLRAAFDQELAELLTPYVQADGQLVFSTKTTLTTARIPIPG